LTRAKFKFSTDIELTPPKLIAPENATFANADEAIEFIWHKPGVGTAENYDLVIFTGVDSIKASALNDTSYILPIHSLQQNKQYSWYVKAINQDLVAKSSTNQFTTNNIAPGPFSLLSPANGDTVKVAEGIDFKWTTSEDTEPVYYKLSVSGTGFLEEYITQDTSYSISPNTLTKDELFIVQVAATDSIEYAYSQSITISTKEAKVDTNDSGTQFETVPFADVMIYPNPATSKITLDLWSYHQQDLTIEIFDVKGELIQSSVYANQFGRNNYTISLDNFDKGTYIMLVRSELEDSQAVFSKKFLVH
jgi:hypothetical protein